MLPVAPSIFTKYIGKEVTIVYIEDGSQHVIKGLLIGEDDKFISIKADVNDQLINKDYVVKIKTRNEGESSYGRG